MELLIAVAIGVMVGCGVYLILRPSTFPLVVGLTFLSYAVNVFLFMVGGLTIGKPAIISADAQGYADPLSQALVLTAIVISFGMTAFLIVLALRARDTFGTDHVDGKALGTGHQRRSSGIARETLVDDMTDEEQPDKSSLASDKGLERETTA